MGKYLSFYNLEDTPRYDVIKGKIKLFEDMIDMFKDTIASDINNLNEAIRAEKKAIVDALVWTNTVEAIKFRIDGTYSNRDEDKIYTNGFIIKSTCNGNLEELRAINKDFSLERYGRCFQVINLVVVPSDKSKDGYGYHTTLSPIPQVITADEYEDILARKIPEGFQMQAKQS